jgi:sugar lactone lactonase YvrE
MPISSLKFLSATLFPKNPISAICIAGAIGLFLSACSGGGSAETDTTSPSNSSPVPITGSLSLVAGSTGGTGYIVDGPTTSARFAGPDGIAVDTAGNVYVTDQNTLRKISGQTVSTVVPAAQQVSAGWLATDTSGNVYYSATNGLRRLSATGADTAAPTPAAASYPFFFDAQGNFYFTELKGGVKSPIYYTVSRQSPTGAVTVLNSGGQPAAFSFPQGMAVDQSGNLYVVESIPAESGSVQQISKLAPDGQRTVLVPPSAATAYAGLAMDSSGNLFAPDPLHHVVRKITSAGVAVVYAGAIDVQGAADGTAGAARFNTPNKIAIDAAGNLFIADSGNHTVRRIAIDGTVTTVAGVASGRIFGAADGTGAAAQFGTPQGITADASGNLYVADTGSHTIRKITPAGMVTTLAGKPGVSGTADGTATDARFNFPTDVAIDAAGNLYVTDTGNVTVRKITPAGNVSTLAGSPGQPGIQDGVGAAARFSRPQGLTIDTAGNLFMTDSSDTTIRKITPSGRVTTFAGSIKFSGLADGVGAAAQLNAPHGITIDSLGNLYVADTGNCALRKITPDANVTTIPNTRGNFCGAIGIAVDSASNLYVTSVNQGTGAAYHSTVVRVTQNGTVSLVAGKADQQRIELGALPGSIEPSYGITRLNDRNFALTSAGAVLKVSID